jgi:hypothetical protein|eukprot:scaffold4049_cov204-Alexandrium_tamarense.AAC.74
MGLSIKDDYIQQSSDDIDARNLKTAANASQCQSTTSATTSVPGTAREYDRCSHIQLARKHI